MFLMLKSSCNIASRCCNFAQATARPTGRQTPDLFRLDRAESATPSSSISFASSASFGMSRGPSPLTIGMSDAIPLAVAFSETVNAYFKGSDQSRLV